MERIVSEIKLKQASKEIMKIMESNGLNVAEAEAIPSYLAAEIKNNSERIQKKKAFTVYKEPEALDKANKLYD